MAGPRPAEEPVFQVADDAGEIRERPLVGGKHVDPLDGVPQTDFVFEVEPVTLAVAFDEYAQQAEKELQVFLAGRQRKRIDREVARFPAHIQIAALEDVRERLEAPADVEDERRRSVLLRILQEEVREIRLFPSRLRPRISVCATSFECRFR